ASLATIPAAPHSSGNEPRARPPHLARPHRPRSSSARCAPDVSLQSLSTSQTHLLISYLPFCLPCCADPPRRIPQKLQLGHQQRAPTMQPGTNRADGAAAELRGFFIAEFFQLAKHHCFAKLRGQI